MEKVFKDVKGSVRYRISNDGVLIRVLKPRKYRDRGTRVLKPSKSKDGYFRTSILLCDGRYKNVSIHRLVAESFIENPENKPCVNHINGIKDDNRVENLEWCTVAENNIHAIRKGLSGQAPGELHHMSKIKKEDVINIISMYSKGGITQKKIAKMYNISQSQIGRIINNKRWNKGYGV